MFPNLVHHKTQGEAALEVHQFYPLVLTNCSSYLTLFLCSLYAPICTILNRPLPPCRGLCNRVKNGCLPLLQKFGFSWPESMACKKFPERNGLGICVDLATIAAVTTQPPRPTDGKISVNDIWNKSYMNCGNEMKVKKWMASFRNYINCVHCDDHFFISFPQFIFALNSSGRWSRKIRRFCRGRHLRPGQMIWEEKKFWHTSGVVKSFYLKETE